MSSLKLLLCLLLCTLRTWAVEPTVQPSLDEAFAALPNWYAQAGSGKTGQFKSQAYLAVAIRLQGLPRTEALEQLSKLAAREDGLKVVPLCRMLFVAKLGADFRAPKLGWGSSCPREDKGDWPLDPLCVVEGVPFLVSPSYPAAKREETGADYLKYCTESCDWNPHAHTLPSAENVERAYTTLVAQIGGSRKGVWQLYFRGQLVP